MGNSVVKKLIIEAVESKASYAIFQVQEEKIVFISDGGSRKSTRNIKLEKAVLEAEEKELKNLEGTNLLFSGGLTRLEIMLLDGRSAYFKRDDFSSCSIIRSKRVNEKNLKVSRWLRVLDRYDQNSGVAFLLKEMKDGKMLPISTQGELLAGAFKTDIKSGLQFLVSFGMDTEVFSKGELEEKISEVVGEIVRTLFYERRFDPEMFSILPNSSDENLLGYDLKIMRAFQSEIRKRPVFKNASGTLALASKMMMAEPEIMDLFSQEMMDQLWGNGHYWLVECPAHSRMEQFCLDIGMKYYHREEFLNVLFTESNFKVIESILKESNDKWLKRFYLLCAGDYLDEKTQKQMIKGLQSIRSIRDSRNQMNYPNEVIYLQDGVENIGREHVLKPQFLSPEAREDQEWFQLNEFFLHYLEIEERSNYDAIFQLARQLETKKVAIDRRYLDRLLELAEYDLDHPNTISFDNFSIFPVDINQKKIRVSADEAVIGKPYLKEGDLLLSAFDRKPFTNVFAKIGSPEEVDQIISFAVKCGAIGKPAVIRGTSEHHPDFKKELFFEGRRMAKDTNYDFYIPGLEQILSKRSLRLNRLVWQAVLNASEYGNEVLWAEYSANGREVVNRCESSIVKILRERTWVPDKNNKLFTPAEIKVEDINDSFVYDRRNPILKALQFGSGEKRREKEFKMVQSYARKNGYELVDSDEYNEFLKWKSSNI